MVKQCQKINLQGPQRNRNATANYVNLIMTSTVLTHIRYILMFINVHAFVHVIN